MDLIVLRCEASGINDDQNDPQDPKCFCEYPLPFVSRLGISTALALITRTTNKPPGRRQSYLLDLVLNTWLVFSLLIFNYFFVEIELVYTILQYPQGVKSCSILYFFLRVDYRGFIWRNTMYVILYEYHLEPSLQL